jgi:hypothetical protein
VKTVKKTALLVAGASAAVAMGVFGAGHAVADVPDVTGLDFNTASAVLKSQGFTVMFDGSIGSDLPESQCIVVHQTMAAFGVMRVRLDCSLHPGQTKPPAPGTRSVVPGGGPGAQTGARPTPGAGTVTVTPVPVG